MSYFDLSFPVSGLQVKKHYHYPLYGALSNASNRLHNAEWLAIHPLANVEVSEKSFKLTPKSELRLRCPESEVLSLMDLCTNCSKRIIEKNKINEWDHQPLSYTIIV